MSEPSWWWLLVLLVPQVVALLIVWLNHRGQAQREHAQWLRDRRLEAYIEAASYLSRSVYQNPPPSGPDGVALQQRLSILGPNHMAHAYRTAFDSLAEIRNKVFVPSELYQRYNEEISIFTHLAREQAQKSKSVGRRIDPSA